jgi:hypothetical protein
MKARILLAAVLSVVSFSSEATEFIKQTTLAWVGVQGARPIQPSTQNNVFINFPTGSPAWANNGGSGGPTCSEGAAVLPVDNPTMRAAALAAIASGAIVSVAVDNTLPMVGLYCQVSVLSIKGN